MSDAFQLFGEIVDIVDWNVATDCVQKIGRLKVSAVMRFRSLVSSKIPNSNRATNLFTVAVAKKRGFILAFMRIRTDVCIHTALYSITVLHNFVETFRFYSSGKHYPWMDEAQFERVDFDRSSQDICNRDARNIYTRLEFSIKM